MKTLLHTPPRGRALDDAQHEIRIGSLLLVLFFVVLLGLAAFVPLHAAVVAPGVVVVTGNRQTVQHRDGGIISAIHVVEGQHVQSGQVLVELAGGEIAAEEAALAGQAIELQAQRSRARAELAGQRDLNRPPEWSNLDAEAASVANATLARHRRELISRQASQRDQTAVLGQRAAQLNARIQGYREQISASEQQEALLEQELVGMRELAALNLVPLPRVRALERAQAELRGRRGEHRAAIVQAHEAIGESRLQILSLRSSRAEEVSAELREVDTRLADILPRLAALRERLERSRIRAPADGRVVGLKVFTVGGVVTSGEALMDIVPDRQPLVIEAYVRPEDADDVKADMPAEVRITAFHGPHLPAIAGVVRSVSADRLVNERDGTPYFRVVVEVPADELREPGISRSRSVSRLQVGLPAEVIVSTKARSALNYLVSPLAQSFRHALREP